MIYHLKGTYASHMQKPLFAFFFRLRLFAVSVLKEADLSAGAVRRFIAGPVLEAWKPRRPRRVVDVLWPVLAGSSSLLLYV